MGSKDSTTKEYIRDNKVFADAFNYFLYDGESVIDPDDLKDLDSTELAIPYYEDKKKGIQTESEQRFRDALKETVIMCNDKATYVILGVENQSDINYAMPVKNIVYDTLQYSRQVTKMAKLHREKWKELHPGEKPKQEEFLSGIEKEDRLTPVITLVIHFGDNKWDGPMTLRQMMATDDEKILSFVPDYRINLIEPAGMTIEEIAKFRSTLREVFSFIKYSKNKEKLLEYLETEERMTHLDVEAAKVIKAVTNSRINIPEGMEEVDMCQAEREWGMEREATGIKIGRAEGHKEGRAEGHKEGRAEGITEGRDEGKLQMSKLINILFDENRLEDIKRVAEDKDYCDKLIKEFKLDV